MGLVSLALLDLDYFFPVHWEWTLAPGNTEFIDAFILRYVMLALLWLALAMLASKRLQHLRVAGFLAAILAAAAVSFLAFEYLNTIRPPMIVRLMPQQPESQQFAITAISFPTESITTNFCSSSKNVMERFLDGLSCRHAPCARRTRLAAPGRSTASPVTDPPPSAWQPILLAQPRPLAQAIAARLGESRLCRGPHSPPVFPL